MPKNIGKWVRNLISSRNCYLYYRSFQEEVVSIPFTLNSGLYWWLALAKKCSRSELSQAPGQKLRGFPLPLLELETTGGRSQAGLPDGGRRLPQPSPSYCSELSMPTTTQLSEALPDCPAASWPAHWLRTEEVFLQRSAKLTQIRRLIQLVHGVLN